MSINKPLWRLMHDAFLSTHLSGPNGHKGFAAEIRAVAEKLEKKRSELLAAEHDMSAEEAVRWLGYEADRAEAGE